MDIEKDKVFFIMHMPPPVHGAAMVGKFIHDSKLVNDNFSCRYVNMMLANSLEDIGQCGLKKLLLFVRQFKEIKNTIKIFHPNLIYVTPNSSGGAFYKDFVLLQFVKMCAKRYGKQSPYEIVVHFHNKGVANNQDKFLDNLLYKVFFKNIKVILLADVLYKDVEKYVQRENVYICPNGIPESVSNVSNVKNISEAKMLFLSNLIISKGVIVLLDALAILKKRDYRFSCVFVGGETAELNASSFLCEVEKRGLMGMVSYEGSKYGDDKRLYFQTSDIFVFPSFNDAFPLVLIEAMQYKLAIVSTDEGGISDMVVDGENGLICERKNPKSLADALAKLLDNVDLRRLYGENGYVKYKNEFTISKFEENITGILHEICEIKKR